MEHEKNELDTLHVSLVSQFLSNRERLHMLECIAGSLLVSARAYAQTHIWRLACKRQDLHENIIFQ